MTYIRADYALTFFIVFVIISMVREAYKDYKFKLKPSDYDSGYKQAIKDVCDKWNMVNKSTNELNEHCKRMRDYLQDKLNGGG